MTGTLWFCSPKFSLFNEIMSCAYVCVQKFFNSCMTQSLFYYSLWQQRSHRGNSEYSFLHFSAVFCFLWNLCSKVSGGVHESSLPLLSILHVFRNSLWSYFFYILSENTSEEMQTWPVAKHILQFSMQLSKVFGLSPSLRNTWKPAV